MVDHNIVWFYVSVNNTDCVVAVMDRSQSVSKVLPSYRVWKTFRLLGLFPDATLQLRLSVKYYFPHGSSSVEGLNLVLDTSFAVVFGHYTELFTLGVVNNLFKPNDKAVVNFLKHFELLLYAFISCETRRNLGCLQPIFVHDFYRVKLVVFQVLA